MKKLNLMLVAGIFLILLVSCNDKNDSPVDNPDNKDSLQMFEPVDVTKTNPMKIYAHYMPWFETNESSGTGLWGIHWTMANKNPENIDGDGKREIASYYYPLIGPYASGDTDVIEYHLLLMKYAGIDGVLIDWYGSYSINDYQALRKNSEALIGMLNKVGLKFAIVYEDRTLTEVVGQGAALANIEAAQADMTYSQSNYFSMDEYIDINSHPLVLAFGPTVVQTATDWTSIFSVLSVTPAFLTLWYEHDDAGANCTGEYAWVYQDATPYATHLDNFYKFRTNYGIKMGAAFPGFNAYYADGGWGGNPFTIDVGTSTFQTTLDKAASNNIQYMQIATWNDFGEGTMIEPTFEFEYAFLEQLQSFTGLSFTDDELILIYDLYELRKANKDDESKQKSLDQAFYYLVSLQAEKAATIINSLKNE